MKNIFKKFLLVLSLSLLPGLTNAQEGGPYLPKFQKTKSVITNAKTEWDKKVSEDEEPVVICFNTSIKVVLSKKENKDSKVKKEKKRETCFKLGDDTVILIDEKGKETVYDIVNVDMVFTENGPAFLLSVMCGEDSFLILIDMYLGYIGINDLKKNKINWYFDNEENSEFEEEVSPL